MKTNHNLITIRRVVLAIAAAVVFDVPRVAIASVGSDSRPSRSALDNARSRYLKTLDYYGLKEWYYIETGNSYELALYDPHKPGDTLSICYIKDNNTLHYPQVMPKGLAQQLIEDRILIYSYQKVLRADDLNAVKPTREGIECELAQGLNSEKIKKFKEYMDSNEAKGKSFATNLAKFSDKTGTSMSDVRTIAAKAIGLGDLTDEQREEVMKSKAVRQMVVNQKAQIREEEWTRLGDEKTKTITADEATKAFAGNRARAESFIDMRDKVQAGEELNEEEKKRYKQYKRLVGYHEWSSQRGGTSTTVSSERVRPRTTRKGHNTEALDRWRSGYKARKDSWARKPPQEGRTVRGQKRNSRDSISISGNRRGKLTLTGK